MSLYKKVLWKCGITLSLFSGVTQAGLYVEGNVGYDFSNIRGYSKIGSGISWPADRYRTNSVGREPVFGGSLGYEWFFPQRKFLSFFSAAATYFYDRSIQLAGNIEQFSLPQFDNYTYGYNIKRQTIMALFQAGLFRMHSIIPYVAGGVGVAFNQASPYAESSKFGIQPRVSPDFLEASQSQFSYTIGLGVYFVTKGPISLNLGYRYIDFGKVQTGDAHNGYLGHLSNSLTSNAILVGMQYMFK